MRRPTWLPCATALSLTLSATRPLVASRAAVCRRAAVPRLSRCRRAAVPPCRRAAVPSSRAAKLCARRCEASAERSVPFLRRAWARMVYNRPSRDAAHTFDCRCAAFVRCVLSESPSRVPSPRGLARATNGSVRIEDWLQAQLVAMPTTIEADRQELTSHEAHSPRDPHSQSRLKALRYRIQRKQLHLDLRMAALSLPSAAAEVWKGKCDP